METQTLVFRSEQGIPGEIAEALHGEQDDLFLSREWFDLIARSTGTGCSLYAALDGGEEAAGLLYLRQDGRRLMSLSNFYTMRFRPILRDPAALDVLAQGIASEWPAWSGIELRCLLADDPLTDALEAAFRRAGYVTERYFQCENWYEPTVGFTADAYLAARPSQLRHTAARKEKRLRREHRVSIEICRRSSEVPAALAAWQHIYARSWKEPERYPDFIPGLLDLAAARGELRLGVLFVDDVPAAAQLWLVTDKRATIYKLAYDEAYAAYSVGTILSEHMFRTVLDEDRPDEIDYGTGSDAYKRDWMSRRREIVGIIAYHRRTARGEAARLRHICVGW